MWPRGHEYVLGYMSDHMFCLKYNSINPYSFNSLFLAKPVVWIKVKLENISLYTLN